MLETKLELLDAFKRLYEHNGLLAILEGLQTGRTCIEPKQFINSLAHDSVLLVFAIFQKDRARKHGGTVIEIEGVQGE